MKYKFLKKTAIGMGLSFATLLPSFYEKSVYSSSETGYDTQKGVEFADYKFRKSILEELVKKERESLFEKRAIEQSSDKIKLPYFNIIPSHCSEYAKKAAKKLFNKEYVWDKEKKNGGAAWNLRYYNPIIEQLDSIGEIKELIIDGRLKQGMIIGMYNPKSPHNRKKDVTGNKVEYTHIMTYGGINKREIEFFHQLGSKIERANLNRIKELENKGWKVIEVLNAPDNLSENFAQN